MYEPVHPKPRTNWWPWLIACVFLAWWARDSLPRIVYGPAEPRVITPRGDLANDELDTIELYDLSSASVVHVRPITRRRVNPFSNRTENVSGTGSGFVWDDSGHVVTNFHVVAGAESVEVRLFDGTKWEGIPVGAAPDKDVAVVRIDAPRHKLRPIPIGDSRDLRVGQKVFAIGNPFGLDFTLTTGVVSALNREIRSLSDRKIHGVIQTDAAINPGNSGGPLLDSAGRLIGMNTAIYSPSGGSNGLGFAVPVDVVNDVVPQLVAHGRVIRPGLGVHVETNAGIYRRLGISGVLIKQAIPGSSAEAAGLQGYRRLQDGNLASDIITHVDDVAIDSLDTLLHTLEQREVGDTVSIGVRHQILGTDVYEEEAVSITLQAIE